MLIYCSIFELQDIYICQSLPHYWNGSHQICCNHWNVSTYSCTEIHFWFPAELRSFIKAQWSSSVKYPPEPNRSSVITWKYFQKPFYVTLLAGIFSTRKHQNFAGAFNGSFLFLVLWSGKSTKTRGVMMLKKNFKTLTIFFYLTNCKGEACESLIKHIDGINVELKMRFLYKCH